AVRGRDRALWSIMHDMASLRRDEPNAGRDRTDDKHDSAVQDEERALRLSQDRAEGVADRFFFQAEDGIRVKLVTGVQTCALPISALALTRLMKSLLFEVSPADPLTYAAASAALVVAAVLGSYLPARRATRVDPVEALR